MPPKYNYVIDHPVQDGWFQHGHDIYDARHTDAIKERLLGTDENVEALLAALSIAGTRTDHDRLHKESQSRGELRLTQNGRYMDYTELAGCPERIGTFINWFSTVAQECFEHASTRESLTEIGLDLGGMRQAGDWSGTGPLDDMARSIPEALKKENPNACVIPVDRGKATEKSYSILPVDHITDGRYNPNFAYAIARRKRNAANINIVGRYPMRVYKASLALIAINQLDERDIAVIRQSYASYGSFANNDKKNSSPAGVVGRVFEKAIQHHEREHSTAVFPISAHYYVTMQRPSAKTT